MFMKFPNGDWINTDEIRIVTQPIAKTPGLIMTVVYFKNLPYADAKAVEFLEPKVTSLAEAQKVISELMKRANGD